jgi:hypothetical protein
MAIFHGRFASKLGLARYHKGFRQAWPPLIFFISLLFFFTVITALRIMAMSWFEAS